MSTGIDHLRELRKRGRRLRIQDKPFQLLHALLERSGDVVTREELYRQLWPADTFVDVPSLVRIKP